MTKRISLLVPFVIAIFTSIGHAQITAPTPSTTLDSAQIVLVDSGDTLDHIVVSSSDPERGCDDCVEKNAAAHTFYINVALGMGDNEFVITGYKNKRYVRNYVVYILRVAADSKAKKTAAKPASQLNSTVAINQKASLAEIPPTTLISATFQTDVLARSGPNTTEDKPSIVVVSNASTVEPTPIETFLSGRASAIPQVAPTPSAKQKALDGEDTSIPINPKARLIFGFEQVGASSSVSKGRPFVDLMFNIPVGKWSVDYKSNGEKTKRYFTNSFWTSFKLTSSPTQTLPDLGGLTAPAISGFFGSNQSNQINDLVQAFEMKIGWETVVRKGFSLIAGVGATSPLTSEKTIVAYKIPRLADNVTVQPEFRRIFGPNQDFTNITNLVLTSGDRDRFMRNWFVGGRLRHQIIGDVNEVYPAIFELTFGQDEVMTNKLVGRVLKFDSFVPIPVKGLKFLYFGASFSSKLTRKVTTTTFPFFLEPAAPGVNIFAPTNFVRNIRDIRELNSDRDGFSFRFGVDLMQLLNKPDSAKAAILPTPAPRKLY